MTYKTLILVDNVSTLSSLNKSIAQETVKYLIKNSSDEYNISVAEISSGLVYVAEYDDSIDTKLKLVNDIQYKEKTMSYTDALMEVLEDWREKDFAGRDIILISDGECLEDSYTTEELYFMLDGCDYPVYVLDLVENGNEGASKKLKSLSRISGGKYFRTDMYDGEASVEQVYGDAILGEIHDYRERQEDTYVDEASQNIEEDEIIVSNQNLLEDAPSEEYESSVIYEMPDEPTNVLLKPYLYIPVGIILFIVLLILLLGFIRQKQRERDEEEFLMSTLKHINKKSSELGSKNISNEDVSSTRALNDTIDDSDGSTRLLYQAVEGVDITLEDRADPTKYYRACIRDKIIVGRSSKLCDVVISHDDSVSSKHCELFLRGDDLYVRDLSSSNGTIVNQQKVYQEIKLNSGDILKLGQLSLFLQIVRRGDFG